MSNPKAIYMSSASTQTQTKLLDAAEQMFAARGYEDVSVRELAAAAGVNVAAVNYHFQGKENLYREVILRRFTAQRDGTLAAFEVLLTETGGRPTVAQVIEVLVGQYLRGALTDDGHSTFLTFVAREMNTGRTSHSTAFFRELVQPVFAAFSEALAAARPELGRSEDLPWVIASIIGQIHHFVLRRLKRRALESEPEAVAFLQRALPAIDLPLPEYIRQTTAHITRFSTAAIDGLHPEETT
jgi:AcrR family transcriptional regulator